MSTPDVSITALATRDPALIRACLDSIRSTQGDLDVEVLVVLGRPSEKVRDVVARTEGVRVIDSDVNTGTAAAWNLAFDLARGPFVSGCTRTPSCTPAACSGCWRPRNANLAPARWARACSTRTARSSTSAR